jgi:RNase P subunit RPR2
MPKRKDSYVKDVAKKNFFLSQIEMNDTKLVRVRFCDSCGRQSKFKIKKGAKPWISWLTLGICPPQIYKCSLCGAKYVYPYKSTEVAEDAVGKRPHRG